MDSILVVIVIMVWLTRGAPVVITAVTVVLIGRIAMRGGAPAERNRGTLALAALAHAMLRPTRVSSPTAVTTHGQ